MKPRAMFESAVAFAKHLNGLRRVRREMNRERKQDGVKRRSLRPGARQVVLAKTGGRCHICGGVIREGARWDADHVSAHAQGGAHSLENFLPAHGTCNNYRWFYSAEEFQWILKLGVWWRTKIDLEDPQALDLAERFLHHERRRIGRRKRDTLA